MKFHSTANGFTLIELMFALAVLGILMSLAIPGFTSLSEKRAVEGAIKALESDFTFARHEARIKGKPVSICQTRVKDLDDGTAVDTATKACRKQAGKWNDGWLIFVDDGAGGGTANDGYRSGSEEVLKYSYPDSGEKIKIVFKRSEGAYQGARNNVIFDPDGRPSIINSSLHDNTNFSAIVCIQGKETDHARHKGFVMNKSGKIERLIDRTGDGKIDIQYVKDDGTRNRRTGNCS